jgi:membrane protein
MGVFSFLYILVPNTRVKLLPALAGGAVAGILWETTGWGFATFISNSTNYAAIYSSFAILMLLLIWVYLNWLILLLGSQVAFYVQFPQYLTRLPVKLELSNRLRERLALHIMVLIADRHVHQGEPWTLEELVAHLGLPMQPVYKVLGLLLKTGYLSETSDDTPAYLPRRDIDTISVADLLGVVRTAGENRFLSSTQIPHLNHVDATLDKIQDAIENSVGDITLRQLVS